MIELPHKEVITVPIHVNIFKIIRFRDLTINCTINLDLRLMSFILWRTKTKYFPESSVLEHSFNSLIFNCSILNDN